MDEEPLWTTDQVAEYLNVSPKTIRNWQGKHAIPFVKLGGAVRYVPTVIRAWVAESAPEPAGAAPRHLRALGLR